MKLTVEREAVQYMKQDWNLHQGDTIRLFTRYGGESNTQPGFSLGIVIQQPTHIALSTQADGILFYIQEDDLWYLDGHDLTIAYDAREEGIEFRMDGPADNLESGR